MALTDEDTLRLNVLLMQNLQAIRIDESRMIVYALTDKGEAKIQLSRPSRDVIYLKKVREVVSNHVMNLPGGYPVFLDRWTRYNQNRDAAVLKNLLLLGEPEAVVAVVHAEGLTPEVATNAWWAMPESENARCLLENDAIVNSELGKELAAFLFEFLPFETQPRAIFNSVRLILQPGLYDEAMRNKLWQLAQRKAMINIGLLQALPDELPDPLPAHPDYDLIHQQLKAELQAHNPFAESVVKTLSDKGQTFFNTAGIALKKLADQETSMALFDTVGDYFSGCRLETIQVTDTQGAEDEILKRFESDDLPEPFLKVKKAIPKHSELVLACLTLGQFERRLLTSFFSRSNTVGSLMRRKLEPWTSPLKNHLQTIGVQL